MDGTGIVHVGRLPFGPSGTLPTAETRDCQDRNLGGQTSSGVRRSRPIVRTRAHRANVKRKVCLGSKSVLTTLKRDFRKTSESRHLQGQSAFLKRARSRHGVGKQTDISLVNFDTKFRCLRLALPRSPRNALPGRCAPPRNLCFLATPHTAQKSFPGRPDHASCSDR